VPFSYHLPASSPPPFCLPWCFWKEGGGEGLGESQFHSVQTRAGAYLLVLCQALSTLPLPLCILLAGPCAGWHSEWKDQHSERMQFAMGGTSGKEEEEEKDNIPLDILGRRRQDSEGTVGASMQAWHTQQDDSQRAHTRGTILAQRRASPLPGRRRRLGLRATNTPRRLRTPFARTAHTGAISLAAPLAGSRAARPQRVARSGRDVVPTTT